MFPLQTSPMRHYSTGKRIPSRGKETPEPQPEVKAKSLDHGKEKSVARKLNMEQTNNNSDLPHSHSGFVQYVHIADGEQVDYYSSPILGATIIMENGVTETRL